MLYHTRDGDPLKRKSSRVFRFVLHYLCLPSPTTKSSLGIGRWPGCDGASQFGVRDSLWRHSRILKQRIPGTFGAKADP